MRSKTYTPKRVFWGLLIIVALGGLSYLFFRGRLNKNENVVSGNNSVTITFAASEFSRPRYETLIEEFQTLYPNITIQLVPLAATDDEFQSFASLADTLILPTLPYGSESYRYLDLEPLMESDATFDPSTFWPGVISGCQVNDRTIGLPVAVQVRLIFYKGTAFDEAGLSRPVPGWTWDDFRNAVQVLTESSGSLTKLYGFVDSQPLSLLGPLADGMLSEAGGSSDPLLLAQSLNWYVDLVRQGEIPVFLEDSSNLEEELIASGQAAMWIDYLERLSFRRNSDLSESIDVPSFVESNSELSDSQFSNINVAPFPGSSDGSIFQTTPSRAECTFISTGSTHPQEAWIWINFLSTRAVFDSASGTVPARILVAEQSDFWNSLDNQTKEAVRFALEHAWYGFISLDPLRSINEALVQAINKNVPLEIALSNTSLDEPAPPPTPTGAPLPVITPLPTATPGVPLTGEQVVNYFVDPNAHTNIEVLQDLAKAFTQAHPEIIIQLTEAKSAFGYNGYNFDDVVQQFDCFADASRAYTSNISFLYSLDTLTEADTEGKMLLDDVPPDLVTLNSFDGVLYGLPAASQPTVMYYNKSYLTQRGLQLPSLNWTVNDFWTLASAAASTGTFGFVPLEDYDFLFSAQGISPLYDFTVNPPVLNFASPETLSVVTTLVEMANNGVIPAIDDGGFQSTRGNISQRDQAVVAGHAAMWTNPAALPNGIITFSENLPFEVGVVPLPLGNGPLKPSYNLIAMFISRQAENPTSCWQWIKYLSAQPGIFPGIPARYSVLGSANLEAAVGPETAAVYRAVMAQPRQGIDYGKVESVSSYPLYWWWKDTLSSVFNGTAPGQALADLQSKVQVYRECVISYNGKQELFCAKQADPNFRIPNPDH